MKKGKKSTKLISMGIIFTFFLGCKEDEQKVKGCMERNSYNYNPSAEEDDGSCKSMAGCLGYVAGYSNSGALGNTFNNAYYDQAFSQEVAIQQSFYTGLPATVYVWYEPNGVKNAQSTPHKQIFYGYNMFYYVIANFNELAAAGVLAHEWGHQAQHTFGWMLAGNPRVELEADAFSGYYMGLIKQWAWSQINGYYSNTYASGNYDFNNPDFHGTPEQRVACAYLGVEVAIQALNAQTPYSYSQLHTIFMDSINTNIVHRKTNSNLPVNYSILSDIAEGKSKGKELVYPRKINIEEALKLRPYK